MQHDVQNDNVKLAAANALLNSLELTRNNFENANERNFIMQVICEATQSINHKVTFQSYFVININRELSVSLPKLIWFRSKWLPFSA